MNPAWVRSLIYPLHERLRGRPTFGNLRDLERSQWLSAQALRQLQTVKLSDLLRHARRNCPYYAALLSRHGQSDSPNDPWSELARLPLLDKPTIRSHLQDMIWHAAPGGLHESVTGGSTGQPLRFIFDRRRQAFDKAARMRTHRWFGVDVGDKEVYLWGSPLEVRRQDRVRNFRDRLTNELLLSAFHLAPERMDRYFDRIVRYDPACLFGYPSSLHLLCQHGRSVNRSVRPPSLRAVFATGELLDPQQARAIGEYFGVPVANGYGSREAGFIAHDCPAGSMHITDENLIVEILDDSGQSLPDGQSGEVVITHLDAYAMPLIRYRTGDCGRRLPGSCSCGRGLGRMEIVGGRRTDHLVGTDGKLVHGLAVIYPLRELDCVQRFEVFQHRSKVVDVRIVPTSGFGDGHRQQIEKAVRNRLGAGSRVNVQLVEHIAKTSSGKHRQVVSDAAAAKGLL